MRPLLLLLYFTTSLVAASHAAVVSVKSSAELRAALKGVQPGTRIEVAPGEYEGGLFLQNVRGEKGRPIIICAADSRQPPHFKGGNGLHLVNPAHVELHHLRVSGATNNGLNIDDGSKFTWEPRGIVLRGLHVTDVGPTGNHDGIKLSGLVGFHIEDCTIERWGTGGGGIDMVGCHGGTIVSNVFRHSADLSATGATGIQLKGGTSDVTIRRNRFEHAGQRSINIGGSTGLQYFRPALKEQWPKEIPWSEARAIVIEGNTFIGSSAPFSFVGVDGATVRFNTIYRPTKWVARILQETKVEGFVPSRNGVITDNVIVYDSAHWSEGGINIGSGTEPQSFRFARNHWYCLDQPSVRPRLPVAEGNGVYGVDPQFENADRLDLRLKSGSAAAGKGADFLPKE